MTSTLLTTIVAILNEEEDIPELRGDLTGLKSEKGSILIKDIPGKVLQKIVRLQTLSCKLKEMEGFPDTDDAKNIATETGEPILNVFAKSLETSEDIEYQIMMIEQIIIEIVRDEFPEECDHFNVRYFAHPQEGLIRSERKRRQLRD